MANKARFKHAQNLEFTQKLNKFMVFKKVMGVKFTN